MLVLCYCGTQNFGAVNDRFMYAHALVVREYISQRWAMLREQRRCIYGEVRPRPR